jgi:exosortase/archaeosortase family protein
MAKRRRSHTKIQKKVKKSNNIKADSHSKKILVFLVKFFVIFAVAQTLIEFAPLAPLNNAIAHVSASALGLERNGTEIIIGEGVFVVSNLCTGLVSASILGAIIFSLKRPKLTKKLALFLLGTIIILIVNIPRVMLVLLTAKLGFNAEFVHEVTWFIMSGIVLIIWYFGTKKMEKIEEFRELI